VHFSHLFVLSINEQAGLELVGVAAASVEVVAVSVVVRNGTKFSQYNVA
jgi:hypothetical protein